MERVERWYLLPVASSLSLLVLSACGPGSELPPSSDSGPAVVQPATPTEARAIEAFPLESGQVTGHVILGREGTWARAVMDNGTGEPALHPHLAAYHKPDEFIHTQTLAFAQERTPVVTGGHADFALLKLCAGPKIGTLQIELAYGCPPFERNPRYDSPGCVLIQAVEVVAPACPTPEPSVPPSTQPSPHAPPTPCESHSEWGHCE